MMQTKNLQGECQHCGRVFEFQAEATGTTAGCPHCGQPTELMPVLPADPGSPMATKAVVFTVIALLILLGGLGGTLLALKRAKRITQHPSRAISASQPSQPADPFAAAGFRVSPVTLEKGQANSLVHAVGTITNTANRQRFAVRVELELQDEAGRKLGTATDYRPTLEPKSEWRFRALVVEKKTVNARIVAIKEDQ